MKKKANYSDSFLDYLDYIEQPGGDKKFVIAVSRNQCAIEMDKYVTHDQMYADLVDMIRPDIKKDEHGNAINEDEKITNDIAIILGEPGYSSFQLPNKGLTTEQFKCIREILYYIKNYNLNCVNEGKQKFAVFAYSDSIKAAFYQDNIEELVEMMKESINDDVEIKPEVIIGREFDTKTQNYESYSDYLIKGMEEGTISTDTNPILGKDSEYTMDKYKKGYVNLVLIGTLTTLISIGILVIGTLLMAS